MKIFKNVSLFFLAPLLALAMFYGIFQIWKIDLTQPVFGYSEDALFMFFIAKNIVDTGWIFANDFIGLPGQFSLNDFPLHADDFNLLLLKFFAQFTKNPFLIINCFFVATFPLIAASAFAALRSFKISYFIALLFALLYAFSPYHFFRGTHHLFLANYAIVPLLVMVAVWLMNDEVEIFARNQKGAITFSSKKVLPVFLIVTIAAVSGIYYMFFASVIFIFIWLLRGLKTGSFFVLQSLHFLVIIGFVVMLLFYINLPTLVYWLENGSGHILHRIPYESQNCGLKISNLLLPVPNHYLDHFANFRNIFDQFPRECESYAESIGVIGSIGFLFLIIWLICGNFKNENSFFSKVSKKFFLNEKDQNFLSDMAILNIFLVLFFVVSGFVMFVAVPFPIFRSHARVSIFICFIALSIVAFLCDKILRRKFLSPKKITIFVTIFFCLGIFTLEILDQIGKVSLFKENRNSKVIQDENAVEKFASDHDFIDSIEKTLPENSAIFILPVHFFPEYAYYQLLIPYIHSTKLRWSFPTITGRETYLWQRSLFNKKSTAEFISEIKKSGFSAIVINHNECKYSDDCKALDRFEAELKRRVGKYSIISKEGDLVFYKI